MSPNLPVALITGASRGIGHEVARLLSVGHYRLALVARTRPEFPDAFCIPADVSDPAAAGGAVARALDHFGRLDAVVHCAGVAPSLSVEQTSTEDWHHVIDTNLSSAFYLAKAAWPAFKRQGGGVVVNVSSEAARDPFPGFAAYGAAKAGLNLLGRSLAKEGAPDHIRVHTIAPAAVETAMFRKLVTTDQWSVEKTLSPADVARVILDCLKGSLQYTSGDVIWLHKTV